MILQLPITTYNNNLQNLYKAKLISLLIFICVHTRNVALLPYGSGNMAEKKLRKRNTYLSIISNTKTKEIIAINFIPIHLKMQITDLKLRLNNLILQIYSKFM